MNPNQNYSPTVGHNMDTEHDPLDLLDIAEWNHDELHSHDHFHLTIDTSPNPDHDQFDEVFNRDPHQTDDQLLHDPNNLSQDSGNMMLPYGVKKPVIPTITTIYEPKFFEIFQAYQQHVQQFEPTIKNYGIQNTHLMTLCLNNLLPFSNWAREGSNALFIRACLFENPDMRPEVRNGLAMILVYVFAAARANEIRIANPTVNIDMFTILMKADTGLGIVNKTSLKIYSDPFGFFNFLKACLSGLIDACAIPENERLNNQQTKKTRRGSKNKDEVESYNYLKSSLIAVFDVPESLQLAKNRVLQILNFWHVKGKSIRTERFSAIFSQMPNINNPAAANPNTPTPMDDTVMSVASHETRPARLSNRSSGGGSMLEVSTYIQAIQNGTMVWDNDSIYEESMSSNSPHPSFYGENSTRNSGMHQRTSNTNTYNMERASSRDETAIAEWKSSTASQAQVQQPLLQLLQTRIVSIPVPAIRFDRIGGLTWTGTNTFLYDFDELQKTTHHVTFYLVDEVKLRNFFSHLLGKSSTTNTTSNASTSSTGTTEEDFDFFGLFRFVIPEQAVAMGFTSLDKILSKSGAVITTWNQMDFPQMKIFVNGWKAQSIQSSSRSISGAPPGPPDFSTDPVLSPTQSMMSVMETFNIGSSPADSKRLSKRRTSGVDLKKEIIRAQQEKSGSSGSSKLGLLNPMMGSGMATPPPPNSNLVAATSASNSRGQSLSVKSEHSPVGTGEARNTTVDLSGAFGATAPPALSLIDYWYLLRSQQLAMTDGMNSPMSRNMGKGMFIFERSAEVGLIIRANPKFNIPEDIWCLFYVEEAIQFFVDQMRRTTDPITNLHMSFGAFLMHLLPQTRILFQYLQHEQAYQQVNMRQGHHHNPFQQFNSLSSGITISYYPHRAEGGNSMNPLQSISESGPPAALMNSQYRTIGTLDQHFQQILTRFSSDCYFHDITLM